MRVPTMTAGHQPTRIDVDTTGNPAYIDDDLTMDLFIDLLGGTEPETIDDLLDLAEVIA